VGGAVLSFLGADTTCLEGVETVSDTKVETCPESDGEH